MHRVLSDNAASARSGSIVSVAGSTSTKTGVAPLLTIAATVGAHVLLTVMTSSPGPTPNASSASQRASVPLATATPCRTRQYFANSRSSSATASPRMNRPLSKTRASRQSIAGRMLSMRRRRSRNGTMPSDVVLTGLLVKLERSREALRERHRRPPCEQLLRLAEVRVVIADVDRAALLGKRDHPDAARTVQADQELGEILQADWRAGAEVEDLPHGLLGVHRKEERVDCIVDVIEVAQL